MKLSKRKTLGHGMRNKVSQKVGWLSKVLLLAFVPLTTMCRTIKLGIAGGPLHFCSLGAIFILFFVFASLFAPKGLSANVFSTTICQYVNLRICQRFKPESTNDHSSVWAFLVTTASSATSPAQNLVFCNFKVSNSCLLEPTSLHLGKCQLFYSLLF